MKTVITLIAILICLTVHSQSTTIHYKKIQTDHYQGGTPTTSLVSFKSGTIQLDLSNKRLTIDTMVYTILKTEKPELADENYYTQSLMVVCTTKTGMYKVYECVLLLTPKKELADLVIKKSTGIHVNYVVLE